MFLDDKLSPVGNSDEKHLKNDYSGEWVGRGQDSKHKLNYSGSSGNESRNRLNISDNSGRGPVDVLTMTSGKKLATSSQVPTPRGVMKKLNVFTSGDEEAKIERTNKLANVGKPGAPRSANISTETLRRNTAFDDVNNSRETTAKTVNFSDIGRESVIRANDSNKEVAPVRTQMKKKTVAFKIPEK